MEQERSVIKATMHYRAPGPPGAFRPIIFFIVESSSDLPEKKAFHKAYRVLYRQGRKYSLCHLRVTPILTKKINYRPSGYFDKMWDFFEI